MKKTSKPAKKTAKRMAEGGLSSRTDAEWQASQPRLWAQQGGPAATISRIVQGAPNQKRRIDDSPETMRKNKAAAAAAKKR